MKPAAAIPAATSPANAKTGTSIVKTAPPKETARITVKPNLPGAPKPVGAGNIPAAKPVSAAGVPVAAAVAAGAAAGAAVVAAKASSKPATTIVKTGTTKVAAPAVKAGAPAAAASTVPVPAMEFKDEGSTVVTTACAGVCALLTWSTAGYLLASYQGWL